MSNRQPGISGLRLKTLLGLVVLVVGGCGSGQLPLARVSGTVMQEGQPVTDAKVVFRPAAGPAATGRLDEQGRFTLSTYDVGDGAVIGEHTVIVVPNTTGVSLEPGKPPAVPQTNDVQIPPQYRRHDSSPLKYEVVAAARDVQFELTP